MVVGWYHSHPGFGCWLSSVDVNTQQVSTLSIDIHVHGRQLAESLCFLLLQSFEQLNPRAVSVVIDPIQSVKGKVVIDAFRLINPQMLVRLNHSIWNFLLSSRAHVRLNDSTRPDDGPGASTDYRKHRTPQQAQYTSSHPWSQPTLLQFVLSSFVTLNQLPANEHPMLPGIAIDYKKTEAEQGMLMNLHKRGWTEGLKLQEFDDMKHSNEGAIKVSSYLGFPFTLSNSPSCFVPVACSLLPDRI